MARQSVDIGVEGNDGTGDSIRESFRKVNDNFRELYAVFGKGGQIGFLALSDTPNTFVGNAGKITAVRPNETGLGFYELVSDSGDSTPNNPADSIAFEYVGGKLKVTVINTKLGQDLSPTLVSPLNASEVIAYDNSTNAILRNTSTGLDIEYLVTNWNDTYPAMSEITNNNIVISKGYADDRYLKLAGGTMQGALTLAGAPTNNLHAATKKYVDDYVATKDSLAELSDVTLTTPSSASLLAFTGTDTNSVDAAVNGDVTFALSGNVLTSTIGTSVIENANISSTAAIAQTKLALNSASTRANATNITQANLGLASFNSAEFTVTNGWVSLVYTAIPNSDLQNSNITIGSSTVSLGGTLTSVAGLASLSATSLTGTLTGDVTGDVTGTSSSATNVDVRARNTVAAVHYITFSESVSGSQRINTDPGLTYNPGSNQMSILGDIVPGANDPTDSGQTIGSASNQWNAVYATTFNGTATQVQAADLAENYLGDAEYEPGTVLIFGGDQEVTVTSQKADRRVAGIVTTGPAHLMNSQLQGDHVIGVALQGRVPCKVLGKVSKGDILITSAIPGYAIVDNDPRVGTVIGKAVGVKLDDSKGYVEVVVGRF